MKEEAEREYLKFLNERVRTSSDISSQSAFIICKREFRKKMEYQQIYNEENESHIEEIQQDLLAKRQEKQSES